MSFVFFVDLWRVTFLSSFEDEEFSFNLESVVFSSGFLRFHVLISYCSSSFLYPIPVLSKGDLWLSRILSKMIELFLSLSWTLLFASTFLLRSTISISSFWHDFSFSSNRSFNSAFVLLTSSSSLIRLSIFFSSCSCLSLCSITKFLSLLYLFYTSSVHLENLEVLPPCWLMLPHQIPLGFWNHFHWVHLYLGT